MLVASTRNRLMPDSPTEPGVRAAMINKSALCPSITWLSVPLRTKPSPSAITVA
ncbi:hypothetical protein D3C71_2248280 [compost metagenome]